MFVKMNVVTDRCSMCLLCFAFVHRFMDHHLRVHVYGETDLLSQFKALGDDIVTHEYGPE